MSMNIRVVNPAMSTKMKYYDVITTDLVHVYSEVRSPLHSAPAMNNYDPTACASVWCWKHYMKEQQ